MGHAHLLKWLSELARDTNRDALLSLDKEELNDPEYLANRLQAIDYDAHGETIFASLAIAINQSRRLARLTSAVLLLGGMAIGFALAAQAVVRVVQH